MTGTAVIRVTNASGFKIPGFQIQLVMSEKLFPNMDYATNGEDYMLPGEIAERYTPDL
jgi:hypothetical protein